MNRTTKTLTMAFALTVTAGLAQAGDMAESEPMMDDGMHSSMEDKSMGHSDMADDMGHGMEAEQMKEESMGHGMDEDGKMMDDSMHDDTMADEDKM